jgi:hypothetical protein
MEIFSRPNSNKVQGVEVLRYFRNTIKHCIGPVDYTARAYVEYIVTK